MLTTQSWIYASTAFKLSGQEEDTPCLSLFLSVSLSLSLSVSVSLSLSLSLRVDIVSENMLLELVEDDV